MAKYVYPAIFHEEESGGYSVSFPDVSGCYTQGGTLAEAVEMAEDALNIMLYTYEEENIPIAPPTDIRSLQLGDNELATLIAADTLEYRRYFDNKSVKKTLTIPNWLNTMSEREHINFSAVLQEALMERLHLT